MKIRKLWELSTEEYDQLLLRAQPDLARAMDASTAIIERVRMDGDAALLDFTKQFDGVQLAPDRIRVAPDEFNDVESQVAQPLQAAIDMAINNIREFHARAMPEPMTFEPVPGGALCAEKATPLDSVCLYVPRGRGSFSSVLCMLAVPAKLAGVNRIIVCTPPGPDGEVDAATLYAAKQIGIDEIYRVGGAQAVAAVAYGTETVPQCVKIIGPANVYATAAKRLLSDRLDPGPIAGPSESIILCDETPNPKNVALNLLVEAEHGENSCAVLVTHSEELVEQVTKIVEEQLPQMTERRNDFATEVLNGYGGVVLTRSLEETIEFTNAFAPEHLSIMVKDGRAVSEKIVNAGEIIIGEAPIISLANYVIGVNAILPTSRWARSQSPVSVRDFLKFATVVEVSTDAMKNYKDAVIAFSQHEEFCGHHRVVQEWEE